MNQLHQSLTIELENTSLKIGQSSLICPVCNAGRKEMDKVIYQFTDIAIVKCSDCHTMHLYPMPDEESLELIYNNNYYKDKKQNHGYFDYLSDEPLITRTYRKRALFVKKVLQPMLSKLTRFHEIGCALGVGISSINTVFSTNASGADISTDAEKACKEKGIPFYKANRKGRHSLQDGQKDVVFLFDVIEHLSDIPHFKGFLTELISEHGYLVITTPNMDNYINKILGSRSPSIKIPQHTIYFNTFSLTKALECNFKLIARKRDYQYVSLPRLIERINHVFGFSPPNFSKSNFRLPIPIPNGMEIYIFKKIEIK